MSYIDDVMAGLQSQYGDPSAIDPSVGAGAPQQFASLTPDVPTGADAAPSPAPAPYLPSGQQPRGYIQDPPLPTSAPSAPAPAPAAPMAPPVPSAPAAAPNFGPYFPGGKTPAGTPFTQYASNIHVGEGSPGDTTRNPQSSATGQYQMTDIAFKDVMQNHPELRGQDKNSPQVFAAYTSDNAKFLQAGLHRPPSDMELSEAQFFGKGDTLKFLLAWQANPNAPVTSVIQPASLAANRSTFYNGDGTPKTLGEVYNIVAQRYGGQGGSGGGQGGGQTAAAGSPGSPMPGTPQVPAGLGYGDQMEAIKRWHAQQPALWDRLAGMQQDFARNNQVTPGQRLNDTINGFQQQFAAADAQQHATAGGIANHALPDASAFNRALENTHAADIEQRRQNVDVNTRAFDAQNRTGLAQLEIGGKNVDETGRLTEAANRNAIDQGNLSVNQQQANTAAAAQRATESYQNSEVGIKWAQYGQANATALQEAIHKAVPNPATALAVEQEFLANGGNSSAPLAKNIETVMQIAAKHAAAGDAITIKEPAKMYDVTTFDDSTGEAKHQTVNAATPDGQKLLSTLPPGARVTDLGAPQSNVTVHTGEPKGEGGGAGTSLDSQHSLAVTTKTAADAALSMLPYLEKHGGTGVLTDTPEGKVVASAIKQAVGIDVVGLPVREVYDKLMQQVQNGLTMPQLKQFGSRPAAAEFKVLQSGQLGAPATTQAARAFLNHVSATADYAARKIESQSDAALTARQRNNTYFDPDNWSIKYRNGNPEPVWNGQSLIDAVEGTATSPPTDTSRPLIESAPAGFADWARDKLGISRGAPPSATSRPAGPVSPDMSRILRGGN